MNSFWIRNNNVQKDNGLAMCFYVKQRATESYEPLVVEVTKDEFELVKKVDVPLEISEEHKAKQEFLHKRWTTAVQAQFRKKSNDVLKFIMKNRGKNDFVLMFYNKFIKLPKLTANEWPEESKDPENATSINESMKEYV